MLLHSSRPLRGGAVATLGLLLCCFNLCFLSVSCTRGGTAQENQESGSEDPAEAQPGQTAAGAPSSKDSQGSDQGDQSGETTVTPAPAGGYTFVELQASVSGECAELFKKIEKIRGRIPVTFGTPKRKVEDIVKDMEECTQLCRSFMERCPGPMADGYVGQVLARILLAGSSHYVKGLIDGGMSVEEAQEKNALRLAEARDLTELALATTKVGDPIHGRASRLLVDLASESMTAEETEQTLKRLLENYPEFSDRGNMNFLVCQTYLRESKCAEALRFIDGVLEKYESDSYYPIYNLALFDALTCVGNLERMEELQHVIRSEYPRRMAEFHGKPRVQAQQSLDTATFWLGLIKYAQGDADAALDYFLESKEHLEKRIAENQAANRRPDPVLQIYLDYRTNDYIKYLSEFHGRVPKIDFDLGDMWVTKDKLTLEESRGKVVMFLCRDPGNRRSAKFLQAMDQLVKERWDDGLRGVVVAYLSGNMTPEHRKKLHKLMRDDHAKLGVTLPAGYDPDTKLQSRLRGIHATVGPSATFAIFNRRGEQAWYHFDPRSLDIALAKRVALRLLEEK